MALSQALFCCKSDKDIWLSGESGYIVSHLKGTLHGPMPYVKYIQPDIFFCCVKHGPTHVGVERVLGAWGRGGEKREKSEEKGEGTEKEQGEA